jgi:hypothetical protein
MCSRWRQVLLTHAALHARCCCVLLLLLVMVLVGSMGGRGYA